MNQEDYPLSDLDSLLTKDNIAEQDLLQLPNYSLKKKTLLAKPTRKSIYYANRSTYNRPELYSQKAKVNFPSR